jgi:hypothetical protein
MKKKKESKRAIVSKDRAKDSSAAERNNGQLLYL